MIYLLDTNTCIRHINGRSPAIGHQLRQHRPSDILLCSVVVAELLFGAAKSAYGARTMATLQAFLAPFLSLPFDDAAAQVYGPLRADLAQRGALIGPNDLLIAAIALTHGLTLVTHNTREFSRVPGLVLADWEHPSA